jgi:riboflavin kinase/FMN adenylyltransferase
MPDHGAPRVIPGGVLGDSEDLATSPGRLFFVVGAFDGLHRGHTYLLARLRAAAARHAARPAVITFDHHPDEILVGAAPPVLCDPAERLVRFGRAGVEVVVVQHFDAAVRMTPYAEFAAAIARRFELAGFLMTPDAAFGHERGGTPAALAELGRSVGFAVDVVEPFELDGRPVRSTDIRSEIATGDLPGARWLLGRSVAVVGRLDGDRVAFELPVALPPAGRYRVEVEPAWAPGQAQASRPVPAVGMVERGSGGPSLSLEIRPGVLLSAGERVRIRFIRAA